MFAVVTDSTNDLSLDELDALGAIVVPLDIRFGDESFKDLYELGPEEFYEKMDAISPDLPKSNCPTPGAFEKAYREAVGNGADGIVVLTLAAGVSGTHNSCVVAAQECADLNVPIRCVDSKATCGVLSMMIKKACKMRDEGASTDECADLLERAVAESGFLIGMDTIINIVKGGRLDKDTESLLALKPVCTLKKTDGTVDLTAKPRGLKAQYREIAKQIEAYLEEHPGAEVRFSQANSLDRIAKLKEELDEAGIAYSDAEPGWICGLIGVYVGNHSYCVNMMPKELL